MCYGPTDLYNLFSHNLCLVGYLCDAWGTEIIGSDSTLGGIY